MVLFWQMKKILLLLLTTHSIVFAQDTLYFDLKGEQVFNEDYFFYSLESELSFSQYEGKEVFSLPRYYKNGELYREGTSIKDGIFHGQFSFYYNNGSLNSQGVYRDGEKVGKWTYWYPNGQEKHSLEYFADDDGNSLVKYLSYYDSTGKQQVINGNGLFEHYNDSSILVEAGYVRESVKVGEWEGWYENGKPYYKEGYKNGKLILGESYDDKGQIYKYKDVYISGFPEGGYEEFYAYVQRSMRYPVKARRKGIQGKVYVKFIVNEQGELTDLEIIKGISGGCDEEVLRIIRQAKPWKPCLKRGQEEEQKVILPVTFKMG